MKHFKEHMGFQEKVKGNMYVLFHTLNTATEAKWFIYTESEKKF